MVWVPSHLLLISFSSSTLRSISSHSQSSSGSHQPIWQASHLHFSFHLTAPSPKALALFHQAAFSLGAFYHSSTPRPGPRRAETAISTKTLWPVTPSYALTLTLSRHFSPTSSDTQIFQTQVHCPHKASRSLHRRSTPRQLQVGKPPAHPLLRSPSLHFAGSIPTPSMTQTYKQRNGRNGHRYT